MTNVQIKAQLKEAYELSRDDCLRLIDLAKKTDDPVLLAKAEADYAKYEQKLKELSR